MQSVSPIEMSDRLQVSKSKSKSKSKKSKKTLFNVGMYKQITSVSIQDGH